ncbi:hypothetical protein CONPUDRAFT_166796 [Coniophora puteana RWD-64-598 SS2]|uniref:Uncharacterized protein n=1 Tax=Coniophora puteana (strain RWD-64-598) TaxID=741705 RepID=A0A5M3MI72_CONPW|nr:uncharacterized protein CONPUDRAFT_166796 [Coniophora puteana RWD-64-598 SS2]EIW78938.1 hypothetical protein CONPUDRAFT_166796 [Coniophora puteana RWD-64-598 SS2]
MGLRSRTIGMSSKSSNVYTHLFQPRQDYGAGFSVAIALFSTPLDVREEHLASIPFYSQLARDSPPRCIRCRVRRHPWAHVQPRSARSLPPGVPYLIPGTLASLTMTKLLLLRYPPARVNRQAELSKLTPSTKLAPCKHVFGHGQFRLLTPAAPSVPRSPCAAH